MQPVTFLYRVQRSADGSALACCVRWPDFESRLGTPWRFRPSDSAAVKIWLGASANVMNECMSVLHCKLIYFAKLIKAQ
jgi:hypothetical protein